MEYLIDLPGQEGCGDSQGEVLGPGLFQIQADSLNQVEAGVNEEDLNEPLQEPFIEDGGLDQEEVDELRLGVEAQVVGQLLQHIVNVFMQQVKGPDAHGKKEQGLSQLEGGNEDKTLIVPPMQRGEPGWGVGHGCVVSCTALLPAFTLTDAWQFCLHCFRRNIN